MSKLGCLWQSQSSFRWKVVSVLKGQNGGRITQPKTLHVLSTPPSEGKRLIVSETNKKNGYHQFYHI